MPTLVRWSLKRRPPPDKLLRNEGKEDDADNGQSIGVMEEKNNNQCP